SDRTETLNFDDGSFGWVGAFWFLQRQPGLDVEMVVNKASQPIPIRPEPIVPDWFYPSRGLRFLPLERELPPQPIASALRRGFDDTVENILNIYATLRSLAQLGAAPVRSEQQGRRDHHPARRLRRRADGLDVPDPLPGDAQHQPGGAELPADPAPGRRADGLPRRREGPRPAAPRVGPRRGDVPRAVPGPRADDLRHVPGYLPAVLI